MEKFLAKYNNKQDPGNYTFKFGKYKGSTFKQVFDDDKEYVAWLFHTLDREKNDVILSYFEERIINDNKKKKNST